MGGRNGGATKKQRIDRVEAKKVHPKEGSRERQGGDQIQGVFRRKDVKVATLIFCRGERLIRGGTLR